MGGAALVGMAVPFGDSVIDYVRQGDFKSALVRFCKNYLGFDAHNGSFSMQNAKFGIAPLAVGTVGTIIANKTINKRIRLPYVKF